MFSYMGDKNEEKVLEYIESHPEDINLRDSNGRTLTQCNSLIRSLLHWACDRGSMTVVKNLLDKGADVRIKDLDEMTALDNALVCEQYEIAILLVLLACIDNP